MRISSRTPEGQPVRCPVCNADVRVETSPLYGDATCPVCGSLLMLGESRSLWPFFRRPRLRQRRATARQSNGRWQPGGMRIRPLAVLIIGPIGTGIAGAIPFICFGGGLTQTLVAALLGMAITLPLFAGVAWAVSPKHCARDIDRVFRRNRRLGRVLGGTGLIAILYIVGYRLFDLHERLAPFGSWLLFAAFLAVILAAGSAIVIEERLKRLRDLVQ